MSDFEDAVIRELKFLRREVERLKVKEKPIVITDHGELAGLADDDHLQYLNETRHDTITRHTIGTVVPHDDHGLLSGLADDDHTQYLNNTRHDTITRHTIGTVVPHDDHGLLSGLADDDHTQYLNNTRHDTITRHTIGTVVPHDAQKADDSAVVHDTGDETIDGIKTFSSIPVLPSSNPTLANQAVRKAYADRFVDGWMPDVDVWTYVNAVSFKILNEDVCDRFPIGTKIKLTQTSIKYFYVLSATYSTDTTIAVTGGSTYSLSNAPITSPHYSYADNPQGFPRTPGGLIVPSSKLWAGNENAPLTSTSWDGDAFSTTGKTLINLFDVFNVPPRVKAVMVELIARDSGSAADSTIAFGVAPNNTVNQYAVAAVPRGLPNDTYSFAAGICPCTASGDIYYQITATGTGTMDCYLRIWGYWL